MNYLILSFIISICFCSHTQCIITDQSRNVYRQNYIEPEQIQSENFVIHFTTAADDFQEINGQLYSLQSSYEYAQSIIDLAEYSLNIYLQAGWEDIPPDCDESITDINSSDHCINYGGNALYDIYISNDGPGMVVPENDYSVAPYEGGRTSFMKISTLANNYSTLPSWSHHVVAHEVHHSIQMRYGTGTSGTPGNYIYNLWFFEQTATYMENVVFPESNHLYTMLANCNVVTPLTYTHYGVDYPAEIYPYRSALWQKFLVNSIGDSSIVRYMWEEYGRQFGQGQTVSLLPIYQNSISIATDNQFSLSEAFSDYAVWRYFTGQRGVQNIYFIDAAGYCTSSTFDLGETYSLASNRGGAYFIDLPDEETNLAITSDFMDDLSFTHVIKNSNDEIYILELGQSSNIIIDSINDGEQALIVTTKYNSLESYPISFTVGINEDIIGDINQDNQINISDVVLIINIILSNESNSSADINEDGFINIIDIVTLVNIILD